LSGAWPKATGTALFATGWPPEPTLARSSAIGYANTQTKLVPLPTEAWDLSDHGRVEVEPETWWVVVPLWTAGEGRSDLSLEATIRERSGQVSIEIDNVHVL